MWSNFLRTCRGSIQLKLFLSLTAIVALGLAAILASQVYLIQDYFNRQAEANLRSSNYLLGRVLADPILEHDLTLLKTRLQDVQAKLPLCDFQLKDNIGTVVYKVGEVRPQVDTEFDPASRDGCYNTIVPVLRGTQLLGTVRMGIRTDDFTKARHSLIQQSVVYALFGFAILMLPFFVQIRRMVQPLGGLSKAAQQFANGNLNYPAPELVQGNDEISQLTNSLTGIAQALVCHRDMQADSLAAFNNEKSKLNALLTTVPVGVVFADRGHVRYCNAAFSSLFMIGPDEHMIGMKNDELLLRMAQAVADADSFLKTVAEILEARALTEPKCVALRDGRILRMIANTVIDSENQRYLGRFWLFEDATEEKKMLQMAEMHAEQDPLTMLYNRHRFEQDLRRAIAQAQRDGSRLALLTFGLDDFGPINDLHGHASGDIVLRQISLTLSTQLRRNEVLYRTGDDKFAMLLVNASDEEAAKLSERIIKSIHSLVFNFSGVAAKVSCSLGIARYPRDAKTLQSLTQLAEQAMQFAKKNGKAQLEFTTHGEQPAASDSQQSISVPLPLRLGIPILDEQHAAMANFIQGITNSLGHGDKSTQLHKRVELLVELCQLHLQTEEDLMRRQNAPGAKDHQIEHQRQLKSLQALFADLNCNKPEPATVAGKINEWLLEHIGGHHAALAELGANSA